MIYSVFLLFDFDLFWYCLTLFIFLDNMDQRFQADMEISIMEDSFMETTWMNSTNTESLQMEMSITDKDGNDDADDIIVTRNDDAKNDNGDGDEQAPIPGLNRNYTEDEANDDNKGSRSGTDSGSDREQRGRRFGRGFRGGHGGSKWQSMVCQQRTHSRTRVVSKKLHPHTWVRL